MGYNDFLDDAITESSKTPKIDALRNDVEQVAIKLTKNLDDAKLKNPKAYGIRKYKNELNYINGSKEVANEILDIAQDMELNLLPKFNVIKKKMDATAKKNNTKAFNVQLNKLRTFINDNKIAIKGRRLNKFRTWWKIVSEVKSFTSQQFQFMRNARDTGTHWLKQADKTPEQKERSAKASERMKRQWAGY